jgi:hypothetical protein
VSNEVGGAQVPDDEMLARFILQSNHYRADGTVKPDAFVPYPLPDLSVTRHIRLSEEQLWENGQAVAADVSKPLYGRADLRAVAFTSVRLTVRPAPVEKNPNHANVSGWPTEKPEQKSKAQEIAANAAFVKVPG